MIQTIKRRAAHYLKRNEQSWASIAPLNTDCTEFEINKWTASSFVMERLIPVVGVHPYPLDELLLMVSAVLRLRPTHIFEWGTHYGASARIFHETVTAFGVQCEIHSSDLPDDVEHIEHPKEARGKLVRQISSVQLHQGDGLDVSLGIARGLPEHSRLLFFLDGDHAYESVRREMTTIASTVPNASILLHDTFFQSPPSGYNVGPHEAVQEFLQSSPRKYRTVATQLGLPGMTLLYSDRDKAR